MSQPPHAAPKVHNRLAIAHLLLWMATTGVALVCLQQYKPGPPERIGFASFLSQAATEEELKIEMDKRRQEIWRGWQARYLIGLPFAPVYGAAGAGLVLAVWRILTLRFGFPNQPGHWLLLLSASFALLWFARPYLQARGIGQGTTIGQDAPDFILAIAMTVVTTIVTLCCLRQPVRWQIAFFVLLIGQATEALAYASLAISSTSEPPAYFGLGLCVDQAFPFLALFCSALDFAERYRYDIFHWVGVVTLLGVAAHVVALIGTGRPMG